ncbi:MAG: SRPBCC family protein [Haloferacaceae archaeon]
MREVSVERVVDASPPVVRRRLDPAALVEYEGSFEVVDSRRKDGATLVTAAAGGLELALRFEPRENGYYYTQEGEAGPFDTMETWVETVPVDDERGTRVTLRSAVSLGLPVPAVTDRIAAWKRRGELDRALDALAADVGG